MPAKASLGGLGGAASDEASGEGGAAGAPVRFECPTSGGSIVLPDPALDAEVRRALALIDEPITAELARQLEVLNLVHLGLHSLAGLECFPQLEEITIMVSTVSDLAPLSGLVHLTRFNLSANQVTDLRPLLKSLLVRGNPLDCAAQAANLDALNAGGVAVTSDCL